jgi:predicted short-subunit dehydrogenase-like oxidoreductase (DUF2520 family)
MRSRVCIIGLGNWGSSLAHAVTVANLDLREVIVRRIKAGQANARAARLPLKTWREARLDAELIWICVPDSAIEETAARLVRLRGQQELKGQVVVHSSGALGADALAAAARAGASVAAVHPMMTFPTKRVSSLKGVPFGVEADRAHRRTLDAFVRRLGGKPFAVRPTGKTLYHLAGMLASPLLVSHLMAASEVAFRAGLSRRQALQVIEPITRRTIDHFFEQPSARSFSGPVARGDVRTIRLHLEALEVHPMLAGVYRSLVSYALETFPVSSRKELRAALLQK